MTPRTGRTERVMTCLGQVLGRYLKRLEGMPSLDLDRPAYPAPGAGACFDSSKLWRSVATISDLVVARLRRLGLVAPLTEHMENWLVPDSASRRSCEPTLGLLDCLGLVVTEDGPSGLVDPSVGCSCCISSSKKVLGSMALEEMQHTQLNSALSDPKYSSVSASC